MNIDSIIYLNQNELRDYVMHKLSTLIDTEGVEAQGGYSITRKLPVFHNGTKWDYLVSMTYLDSVLGGLAWKDDAKVAADFNIPLSGLVIGTQVDTVTLQLDDRALLFNQDDATENGLYLITSGAPIRTYDLDEPSEFNNAVVPISDGATYKGNDFRCATVDPVLGTDPIIFTNFTPTVPYATDQVAGKIRIATQAEVDERLDNATAVTPKTLGSQLSPIEKILNALVPPAPAMLQDMPLVMYSYQALEAATGLVHSCTDSTAPEATASNFYDGDSGILTAEVDGIETGNRVLTDNSDVGVYGSLHITANDDPYTGEFGAGIYKQLTAKAQTTVLFALGEHTYQLKHSETGESAIYSFYVDDPDTVTIDNVAITLPVTSRTISGVPSLSESDVVNIDFDIIDAVKTHYNNTRVATVDGYGVVSVTVPPPVTPPNTDDILPVLGAGVVLGDVYNESIQLSIYGYSSNDVDGTINANNTNARIDMISNELVRKTAGSGQYPQAGYGAVYLGTSNLKTQYTEELQIVGGMCRYPTGDYTANQPTAGPDYSSGMGTDYRYILFDTSITLSFTSNLIIELQDIIGNWTGGAEAQDLRLQVKVEGESGWLDANKAFTLVGAPTADGDPCMVYSDSTEHIKKVSFGNVPRSGKLWVRVGLPFDSDKEFNQEIIIRNIN